MIRGYPRQPSPRAGEAVTLHVSTDAPRFRVELYRCGERMELLSTSPWLPGVEAPLHLPFQDWGESNVGLHGEPLTPWRAYEIPTSAGWRSGVLVAVLVEGDTAGRPLTDPDRTTPEGPEARALVVLRPASGAAPAPILYKVPVLTYHAYGLVDGSEFVPGEGGQWCLYSYPRLRELPRPVPDAVSLHRPGGGTGGVPYDRVRNPDPFDPTPRQTFVHWDARFVAWLEREGYEVDYCTDVDLHRAGLAGGGAALLGPHRLLLSAGHDEYWTDAMRDAAHRYVAGGGNIAWFSGNTCWWRVVFDGDATYSREHVWSDPDRPGEPENTLLGVSFRNGGERDRDDHPVPVGYRVQHADHWVYAGTGLNDGDVFGGAREEYLVGYECDGADFDRVDLDAGRPVVPSGTDGTPSDFTILAVGDLGPHGWGFGNAAATLGLHSLGGAPGAGTVFTASTTDWARVLTAGTTPAVERITRTVLDRLSAPPADLT